MKFHCASVVFSLAKAWEPGQVYMPIMDDEKESASEAPDTAAVFAVALSLWNESWKRSKEEQINLSEVSNGGDQFMRDVMAVGDRFERWADKHINFVGFSECWPYLLEEKFGNACLKAISLWDVPGFDDVDCLRVAMRLQLPIKLDGTLPVPVDVTVANPIANSGFKKYRIQTLRDLGEEKTVEPYGPYDEPFDEDFDPPYFGIYGIGEDGLLEHIADRKTYQEAVILVRNFAPEIVLPECP